MLDIATQVGSAPLGQVIAALIAAVALILLGIANIVVTIRQGEATRKAAKRVADREQWWERFTWAAEQLFSADEERALVAVSVLNALAAVEWIDDEDREMIVSVFDLLNADITGRELEGADDDES